MKVLDGGAVVLPVWNKSNREHTIIGSEPASVRQAADAAVKALGWKHPYFCDADHIGLQTVGRYLSACDFYTIDVADFIGQAAPNAEVEAFVKRHSKLIGQIRWLKGIDEEFEVTESALRLTAQKFLAAIKKAGEVYRAIVQSIWAGNLVPVVSMDETNAAQIPVELLIILAAVADENIPIPDHRSEVQAGRFNKGVDYVGDVAQFEREFALDVAAIAHAVAHFGLPSDLKLSVHSGSDKFSIYPAIHSVMKRFDAGVHLKTAGTTWLEELIGLAEAGGAGLALAKEIYAEAYAHREELCAPYATVIDIDAAKLPGARRGAGLDAGAVHVRVEARVPGAASYNSSVRQLLHVGFKVAAKKMGPRYLDLLEANEPVVAKNVTEKSLHAPHRTRIFGRTLKSFCI